MKQTLLLAIDNFLARYHQLTLTPENQIIDSTDSILQTNTIVLYLTTVYYFIYGLYHGYLGEYNCTVIEICLLLYLWFISRLPRRIQLYCNRTLFTTLSMVYIQSTQADTSVMYQSLFTTLSKVYPSYIGGYKCTIIDLC